MSDMAGDKPVLRAYELATGRQIGELTSPASPRCLSRPAGPRSLLVDRPRRSQDGRADPGKGAASNRGEVLRLAVRQGSRRYRSPGTGPGPIESHDRWTYFDADGTRLLISGWQEDGAQRQSSCHRALGSRGAEAADVDRRRGPRTDHGLALSSFSIHGQKAFATLHDPQKTRTASEPSCGRPRPGRSSAGIRAAPEHPAWDPEMAITSRLDDRAQVHVDLAQDARDPRIPGATPHYLRGSGARTAVSQARACDAIRRTRSDVTLTDLETGRTRAVLPGQAVLPGAFTPDGKRLATRRCRPRPR